MRSKTVACYISVIIEAMEVCCSYLSLPATLPVIFLPVGCAARLRKSPGTTSHILLAGPPRQLNCARLPRRVSLSVHAPGTFAPAHSTVASHTLLPGNLCVHFFVWRCRCLSRSAINRDTSAFGSSSRYAGLRLHH